jgi:ribose transport system ATP-binding protein
MQRLTFHDMAKAYGGVPALAGVTLTLAAGRVHALMGENGAGKSTLIRLIAGVVRADSLRATSDDTPVALASPADAHAAGFRFIHQELNIVPQVSVAENILLGRAYPRRFGLAVDWRRLHARARAALAELGAGHIDVRAPAGELEAGDRMLVRIASALVTDAGAEPCLYVLDEPTAALTGEESERLFAVIARLRARGAAVLYVSHRMDEVLRLCDDVTVLRDGAHVSTRPVAETSRDRIIQDMTGRDLRDGYPPRASGIGARVVARLAGAASGRHSGLTLALRAG